MHSTHIRQLVILAGGLGERLKPITDVIPKPMLVIEGKPFIMHLIDLAKKFNFSEILILAGYRGEVIENYIQRVNIDEIKVEVLISKPDFSTLERLISAYDYLEPNFCLAYGDVLIQNTPTELAYFKTNETDVSVLAYKGIGYHNRRNLRHSKQANIYRSFDSDNANEFDLLNLGWFKISRDILPKNYPKQTLEDYLLNSKSHSVNIVQTENKYYTIGTSERISSTSRYLRSNRQRVIFDRDGTINRKAKPGKYILDYSNFQWINSALEAFKLLNKREIESYVLTNQPAVGNGLCSRDVVDTLHTAMVQDIISYSGRVDAVLTCYHGWNDNCNCRKPKLGLFTLTQHLFDINWNETLYIGDQERDYAVSNMLGIDFYQVSGETDSLVDTIEEWVNSKSKIRKVHN